MTKLFLNLFFLTIFLATFFLRLAVVTDRNLPVTMDQGRDLIDIRSIAVGHKPKLVGPTTSINGVLLGPFWYYFNLPPFIAGGGDPSALLYWQIAWYQIVGLALYLMLKKYDALLALVVSILFLISPVGFNTSRYSWNANAMPIFTAIYLLVLYLTKKELTPKKLLCLGLIAGLSLQVEAAFGIIFFPFSILYLLFKTKNPKLHLWHIFGFLITLIPQVIFEIRHQFMITKVFIGEISGQSNLLGENLTLNERIINRLGIFQNTIHDISHLPASYLYPLLYILFILALILLLLRKTTVQKLDFPILNFSFIIFAFFFYILFPSAIKSWYLLGLSVPFVFLYASLLTYFSASKNIFPKIALALLLVITLYSTYIAQSEYLSKIKRVPSDDPSNLKNQLAVLDWVYQEAGSKPFRAYNYVPSVYDFSWNYLYWWYGADKYGYHPNDVAYLPNQPEYIEKNNTFFNQTKPEDNNLQIFLIIENDSEIKSRETNWQNTFNTYCQEKEKNFPFGLKARKLIVCSR